MPEHVFMRRQHARLSTQRASKALKTKYKLAQIATNCYKVSLGSTTTKWIYLQCYRSEGATPFRPSMPSLVKYKSVVRKDFFGELGGVVGV